jgi:hypothetical protein
MAIIQSTITIASSTIIPALGRDIKKPTLGLIEVIVAKSAGFSTKIAGMHHMLSHAIRSLLTSM